ncbi:MAG TPA: ADOP family duplicated permease, partial [Terriglobales bacterium]|nr:ADOP family duplicated permease [Terriglobales bacterium]
GIEQAKEAFRDEAGFRWLRSLGQDLRYALRLLRRNPGFTAVAVLSLALGIGVNTAVFSILNYAILRPLPVSHSEELLTIAHGNRTGSPDQYDANISYPQYLDIRDHNPVFSGITAFWAAGVLCGRGAHSLSVADYEVSADYFEVIGVKPFLGRTFSGNEGRVVDSDPVVVVGYNFWKSVLGGDANILGKTIPLSGHPFTVIGVAPKGFIGTERILAVDLWVPITNHRLLNPGSDTAEWMNSKRNRSFWNVARLRPGVSPAAAGTWVENWGSRPISDDPNYRDRRYGVAPPGLLSPGFRSAVTTFSLMLLAVVSLVLLLACANIANLLLAQGVERQRELAIRLTIGGSRARLFQQLLTHSLLLSLLGGGAGLMLALWLDHLLLLLRPMIALPLAFDLSVDSRTLGFALLVSLATVILCGLIPAFQAARADPAPALKSATSLGEPRRYLLKHVLIAAQATLSLLALVAALLMVRSLWRVQATGPGFDASRVLAVTLDLGQQGYSEKQGREFYPALLREAVRIPGVEVASLAGYIPLSNTDESDTEAQSASRSKPVVSIVTPIAPGYFRTLGIPLLAGRDFDSSDRESSTPVVIINQFLARELWPGQDPIGKVAHLDGPQGQDYRVVGMAADGKYETLGEGSTGFVYRPATQDYLPHMNLLLRTAGPPLAYANAVRNMVAELDPNLAITEMRPMGDFVNVALLPARLAAILLGSLGLLALTLAAIGIYGVVSYAVNQRTREIGIRMALGAETGNVLRLMVRQGMMPALFGLGIGFAAALAAAGVLGAFLYGIRPHDPVTFASSVLLLLLVALLAAYGPARRAARVDPSAALRWE